MIAIVILYIICALTFTISKAALATAAPLFFMGVRMIFAGVVLLGYMMIKNIVMHKSIGKISWIDWLLFLQIILFHIYLPFSCDLNALRYLTSTQSSVLFNLTPFITALLSYWWFKERMTSKKWFGLILGFSAFLPGVICDIMRGCFFKHVGPQLLTIAAVACSSYGWVLMRRLVKEKKYSPLTVNGIGMLFGGILALATSGIFESWSPSPVVDMRAFIYLTLLIVIVANIIFYNFYSYLLKKYTATFLSFAGFLCPLFTALFGMIFLGECINWTIVFAMGLVSVGLYIFYEEELHQGYIQK